jgi:hypothetical protein
MGSKMDQDGSPCKDSSLQNGMIIDERKGGVQGNITSSNPAMIGIIKALIATIGRNIPTSLSAVVFLYDASLF